MNKILLELYVPTLEQKYNIFVPTNRTIEKTITLLQKAINEITDDVVKISDDVCLYNKETGQCYSNNEIIKNTDLQNGSKLILM